MKKIILFLTLSIFLASNVYSQFLWSYLNPTPSGATINDIKFVNNNTGFCVGFNGTLMKTTNIGLNWSLVDLQTNNSFFAICFPDTINGFISSTNGKIYKSTNKGANWNLLNTNYNTDLLCIFFLNSLTGLYVFKTFWTTQA